MFRNRSRKAIDVYEAAGTTYSSLMGDLNKPVAKPYTDSIGGEAQRQSFREIAQHLIETLSNAHRIKYHIVQELIVW